MHSLIVHTENLIGGIRGVKYNLSMIAIDGRHDQSSAGVSSGLLLLARITEGREPRPLPLTECVMPKKPEEAATVTVR